MCVEEYINNLSPKNAVNNWLSRVQEYMNNLRTETRWKLVDSPITWREAIEFGGKKILIGDANDFQEYCANYYGIASNLTSYDMIYLREFSLILFNSALIQSMTPNSCYAR